MLLNCDERLLMARGYCAVAPSAAAAASFGVGLGVVPFFLGLLPCIVHLLGLVDHEALYHVSIPGNNSMVR
jgi:hypothetical protein